MSLALITPELLHTSIGRKYRYNNVTIDTLSVIIRECVCKLAPINRMHNSPHLRKTTSYKHAKLQAIITIRTSKHFHSTQMLISMFALSPVPASLENPSSLRNREKEAWF